MKSLWWRLRVWLDPAAFFVAPMWFVDLYLREEGLDPEEISRRGRELVDRLLEEQK